MTVMGDLKLADDPLEIHGELLCELTAYLQPVKGWLNPVLVVEGVKSSGKTFMLQETKKTLDGCKWIDLDCRRIFGMRGIVQRCLSQIYTTELQESIAADTELEQQIRERIENCDGLQSFMWTLEVLIELAPEYFTNYSHIVVLDHIDKMLGNDSPVAFATALARLHEQIPSCDNFCFVFVHSSPNSLDLTGLSLPTVYFPPYTEDEFKQVFLLKLMKGSWRDRVEGSLWRSVDKKGDTAKFFRGVSDLFLESFSFYLGSDIDLAIRAFDRLFPQFLEPVAKVGLVFDAATFYDMNKRLLQSEWALRDALVEQQSALESSVQTYDLPSLAKYIIIAAYLASFTDPRYDLMLFSKTNEVRANTKLLRKIRSSKSSTNSKMNQPQAFPLERLLAILHAIHTGDEEELNSDVLLLSQLSTLASLKLILRSTTGDSLTTAFKWKCNVNWTMAKKFADDVGFEIQNYFME